MHTVSLSAFYMDSREVSKAWWDGVYDWATNHGYRFDHPGSYDAEVLLSKGPDHPVQTVSWLTP